MKTRMKLASLLVAIPILIGCGAHEDPTLVNVGQQQILLSDFQRAFDEMVAQEDSGYSSDSVSARSFLQVYVDKTLLEQMAADSIPWTPVLERRAVNILENRMVRAMRADAYEIPAMLSDEQLREIYEKGRTRYHYLAIPFRDQTEAGVSWRAIREGAMFQKVAEHAMGTAEGVDQGWQTILSAPEAVIDVLAELGPGEVAGPVLARAVYYLVQLVETAPNPNLLLFEEVQEDLRRKCRIERGSYLKSKFRDRLFEKYALRTRMAEVLWLTQLLYEKTRHISREYQVERNADGSIANRSRQDAVPWEHCPIPDEDWGRVIATSSVDTLTAILILDHMMGKLLHTWPTFESPEHVVRLAQELALDRLERAEAWAAGYDQDPDLMWDARKKRNLILTRQFFMRKIRGPTRPPTEEVRAWYEAHQERYQRPEERRCILASAPIWDDALAVQRVLVEVPDATSALATVREQVEQALIGSSQGLTIHEGQYRSPLALQLFRLTEGEVSDPFPTDRGFTVLRLEEIHPGRLVPFEEVAEEIADQLGGARADSLFEALLRDRRAATPVRIHEDVFRQLIYRQAQDGDQ